MNKIGEKMGVDEKYGCSSDKLVSVRKPQPSYTLGKYFFSELVSNHENICHRMTPPSKAKDGGIMLKP